MDRLVEQLKSRPVQIIGGLVLILLIGSGLRFWRNLGDNRGYAPVQPIPFSHKLHAGENKIPCLYCHTNADKSKHATVPSMNVCMNCHAVVKTESPQVQRLKEMVDRGEPIPWVKVHDLPDFVHFSHKRHVQWRHKQDVKRKLNCQDCHGAVETMDRVRQEKILNMGFCMQCHRNPEINAPITCYTCHQ